MFASSISFSEIEFKVLNLTLRQSHAVNLGLTVMNSIRQAHEEFRAAVLDWKSLHGQDTVNDNDNDMLMQYDAGHHVHNFHHLKLKRLNDGKGSLRKTKH